MNFLTESISGQSRRLNVLIILNNKLIENGSDAIFLRCWQNSHLRICADGGANKLLGLSEELIPDAICGDLDSITNEAYHFYKKKGVRLLKDVCQDTTDLDKCLNLVCSDNIGNKHRICIFGAFGGRVDHEMAIINRLFLFKDKFLQIYLVSPQNYMILLDEGINTIGCEPTLESGVCGLIPIGGEAIITTQGLKWDVTDWKTSFGGAISSSNMVLDLAMGVIVHTNRPLLWTSSLHCPKLNGQISKL